MPPNQRSLLQTDVRNFACAPPKPLLRAGFSHLRNCLRHPHLISVAIMAALAVYLFITTPSASTAIETTAPTAAESTENAETTETIEIIETTETLKTEPTAAPTANPAPSLDPEATALELANLSPAHPQMAVPEPGTQSPEPPKPLEPLEPDLTAAPPDNPDIAADAPNPEVAPTPDPTWVTATVRPHGTLSQIFKRHGLNIADAYAVAKLEGADALRTIRPGQEIHLAAGPQGQLVALQHHLDPLTTLRITRDGGRLSAETVTRTPEIKLRGRKAVIRSSLLGAAKDAGLAYETIYAFAHLFDWQVDFAREIHSGDQLALIFEERYVDGEKIGNGDIVAAELLTSGRRLQAVRHIDEHGHRAYYAPNGDSLQRSFLRSPVEFGRVTSNFSHKRFHPILKKWRPHRGVDYGVPRGTPVRATGSGVVILAGSRYGYGKTVTIRHGEKYTTLYAHLKGYAKGVKIGARVEQGQVIGYVGATGLATGPHLHYEFRIGGVHHNPLTVELPKSDPIAERYKPEFLAQAERWVATLKQIDSGPLAQLDLAQ